MVVLAASKRGCRPSLRPMKIACVVGTRPEAIKLSPVIHRLRAPGSAFRTSVVASGQHRAEVAAVLAELDLHADETLDDCRGQALTQMTASLIANLGRSAAIGGADLVMVQGDTTTAFAGALAAFHHRVPVAHLEAGLRTGIPDVPFPEEGHRTLVAVLAAVHLAPSEQARRNLRSMGIPADRIAVTGNTCVDVLTTFGRQSRADARAALALDGRRVVLVTLHRRESWDGALGNICDGIAAAVREVPDALVVFPVYANPLVRELAASRLAGLPRVRLLEPLPYRDFMAYLHAADVVVTDSGGVQEESVTLGKQVLIVRAVTDRPEAVEAGLARLVGTDGLAVTHALRTALRHPTAHDITDVYGDGRAAERVFVALTRWRARTLPLLPRDCEFQSAAMRDTLAAG